MSVLTLDCRFNNSDKGSVRHAIVHKALWEYLSEVAHSDDSERQKLFCEMFERYTFHSFVFPNHSLARSCKDLLAEMVHTKDGSRVVREFLARGTAKVRCVLYAVLV